MGGNEMTPHRPHVALIISQHVSAETLQTDTHTHAHTNTLCGVEEAVLLTSANPNETCRLWAKGQTLQAPTYQNKTLCLFLHLLLSFGSCLLPVQLIRLPPPHTVCQSSVMSLSTRQVCLSPAEWAETWHWGQRQSRETEYCPASLNP